MHGGESERAVHPSGFAALTHLPCKGRRDTLCRRVNIRKNASPAGEAFLHSDSGVQEALNNFLLGFLFRQAERAQLEDLLAGDLADGGLVDERRVHVRGQ